MNLAALESELSQIASHVRQFLDGQNQDRGIRQKDSPCLVVLRLSHNSFTRGFET